VQDILQSWRESERAQWMSVVSFTTAFRLWQPQTQMMGTLSFKYGNVRKRLSAPDLRIVVGYR
jgi:hypothetical protein